MPGKEYKNGIFRNITMGFSLQFERELIILLSSKNLKENDRT
jgi:hypothetical protein